MSDGCQSAGLIFDIQRFSVHDGPGIRTTVFLKGCSLRCFWCQNPESQLLHPQIFLYKDQCTRCGRCVAICVNGGSRLGLASSEIDRGKCTGCGHCVKVCPNHARRLVGTSATVAEVLREVMKDQIFYRNSGGGVTLSGGEPFFQPDFALEILKECKRHGLHTTVETCGCVPWSNIEKALPFVDLVLLDVKHLDAVQHRRGTGAPNQLILENAERLATRKPMRVRVPLIPGFNDAEGEIEAIALFVHARLPGVEIDLLGYNKMGESKYLALDRAPICMETQPDQQVRSLRQLVGGVMSKCQVSLVDSLGHTQIRG